MTAVADEARADNLMRAAVMTSLRTTEVQTRPIPVPVDDEVLVRIDAVGVCGSDTHFYVEGHIGDLVVTGPLVLGHECAGTIVAIGPDVSPARIDQRVAIEPQHTCGVCRHCKAGDYNLCPRTEFLGCPPVDGAFTEYVLIREDFAHPVPDQISSDEAALLEPVSVAICAARKAHITGADRILISGAGPIGILTAQVVKAYGATTVIVSDVSAQRLDMAASLGATRTIDVTRQSLADVQVDAFIDCSGNAGAITAGIGCVRPAGRVVLVGMGADAITLPLAAVQHRELVVTGVFRYANTWPAAIALVASGQVQLQPLLSRSFPLEQVHEALLAAQDDPHCLKAVVEPARDRLTAGEPHALAAR